MIKKIFPPKGGCVFKEISRLKSVCREAVLLLHYLKHILNEESTTEF